MRYLEVRRHTMRQRPGKHLTQAGVTLARQVGEGLGPFDRVLTSPKPRAFETALAMGFAVDEQLDKLGDEPSVLADFEWPTTFAQWAQNITENPKLTNWAQAQAKLWREILDGLPEDGKALIITHGGFIEAGAVALLPDANHASWGASCGYCEGVRITLEDDLLKCKILRLVGKNSSQ